MRDLKGYTQYQQARLKEAKEKSLMRSLRKEVNIGDNGTQEYVIKQGPNRGRVAKDFQK
tara:strand:+ start:409 stop:585 length:177 start_codon:yes stop_codon:yes gene_type:complete